MDDCLSGASDLTTGVCRHVEARRIWFEEMVIKQCWIAQGVARGALRNKQLLWFGFRTNGIIMALGMHLCPIKDEFLFKSELHWNFYKQLLLYQAAVLVRILKNSLSLGWDEERNWQDFKSLDYPDAYSQKTNTLQDTNCIDFVMHQSLRTRLVFTSVCDLGWWIMYTISCCKDKSLASQKISSGADPEILKEGWAPYRLGLWRGGGVTIQILVSFKGFFLKNRSRFFPKGGAQAP